MFDFNLGIIKEIEWRFQEQDYLVREFDGIIVIDELELHFTPRMANKNLFCVTRNLSKCSIYYNNT